MKYIHKFLTNIMKKDLPKPLGRWNIDYCDKQINRKIDLSNEDHCGPCGVNIINKKDLENKKVYENELKNIHP
jgi:hypothetical protein